jgi:hypothetical protein
MSIEFRPGTRIIFIDSSQDSVTIQELINAIRDWEDSSEGIVFPQVAFAYGKILLAVGKYVGITLVLVDDWRIEFEARGSQTFCIVTAGNIVAENVYSNNPISPSTNVNVIVEQDTSAALLEGAWTVTEKDDIIEKVNRVLGMVQENFRIKNQAYDVDGNLTSATIRIYSTVTDCDNDVNPLAEYSMVATYDAEGCKSYKVTKV